ncbi:NUDIX hydrolase [Kribbella turkmenica]|uniref:NUDIX hydrolase n=1 Tax=Kribbella turkmenica TaxID=2530375 RepID=UPI002278862C|nr:NUDIX domain-containing protein [Kribbella turkmenica]
MKVLLLDQADRLLLLRGDEYADGHSIWFPVGGGLENGEDAVAAALREIDEETGCRDVTIGPEVWRRQHLYSWRGTRTDVHERWFVARTSHFTPSTQALSDEEQTYITGFHWWTAGELIATTAEVFPPDLGTRFQAFLRSGAPATPIDISQK